MAQSLRMRTFAPEPPPAGWDSSLQQLAGRGKTSREQPDTGETYLRLPEPDPPPSNWRQNVEQSLSWTNEGVMDKSGHRVSEGIFQKSLEIVNHSAHYTSQATMRLSSLSRTTQQAEDSTTKKHKGLRIHPPTSSVDISSNPLTRNKGRIYSREIMTPTASAEVQRIADLLEQPAATKAAATSADAQSPIRKESSSKQEAEAAAQAKEIDHLRAKLAETEAKAQMLKRALLASRPRGSSRTVSSGVQAVEHAPQADADIDVWLSQEGKTVLPPLKVDEPAEDPVPTAEQVVGDDVEDKEVIKIVINTPLPTVSRGVKIQTKGLQVRPSAQSQTEGGLSQSWRLQLCTATDDLFRTLEGVKHTMLAAMRFSKNTVEPTNDSALLRLQGQIEQTQEELLQHLDAVRSAAFKGLDMVRHRGCITLTEKHQLVEAVVGVHREVYMVLTAFQQELVSLLPEFWKETSSSEPSQNICSGIRKLLEQSWNTLLQHLAKTGEEIREAAMRYDDDLSVFCRRVDHLIDSRLSRAASQLRTALVAGINGSSPRPALLGQEERTYLVEVLQNLDQEVQALLHRIPGAITYAGWGARGAGNDEEEDDRQLDVVLRTVAALPRQLDMRVKEFAARLEKTFERHFDRQWVEIRAQNDPNLRTLVNSYRCAILGWRLPLAAASAEASRLSDGDVDSLSAYAMDVGKVVGQYMLLAQHETDAALCRMQLLDHCEDLDPEILMSEVNTTSALIEECSQHAVTAVKHLHNRIDHVLVSPPKLQEKNQIGAGQDGGLLNKAELSILQDGLSVGQDIASEAAELMEEQLHEFMEQLDNTREALRVAATKLDKNVHVATRKVSDAIQRLNHLAIERVTTGVTLQVFRTLLPHQPLPEDPPFESHSQLEDDFGPTVEYDGATSDVEWDQEDQTLNLLPPNEPSNSQRPSVHSSIVGDAHMESPAASDPIQVDSLHSSEPPKDDNAVVPTAEPQECLLEEEGIQQRSLPDSLSSDVSKQEAFQENTSPIPTDKQADAELVDNDAVEQLDPETRDARQVVAELPESPSREAVVRKEEKEELNGALENQPTSDDGHLEASVPEPDFGLDLSSSSGQEVPSQEGAVSVAPGLDVVKGYQLSFLDQAALDDESEPVPKSPDLRSPDSSSSPLPELKESNSPELPMPPRDIYAPQQLDLFESLRQYIRRFGRRLDDLFREHDRDRDGCLSYSELGNLLRKCHAATNHRALRHFILMCKKDRTSKVTYKELANALKESERLKMGVQVWDGQDVNNAEDVVGAYEVLMRLSSVLRAERCAIEKGFQRFDRDADGFLNELELAHMSHTLFPPLMEAEGLYSVKSMLQVVDRDQDGLVSVDDLRASLVSTSFVRNSKSGA